jgi:hypothetical protein
MRKSLGSGRIYEPNYYLFWSVYRRAHDLAAAPKDAPNEATDCGVRNPKDVPVMWVNHISTKGVLLGVRQVSYNRVFDCREVNRSETDTEPRCGLITFDPHPVENGPSGVSCFVSLSQREAT